MRKIIWLAWFQGWEQAPGLVTSCLASWQSLNPEWEVRPLSLADVRLLLDLPDFTGKEITSASFSDLVRISLLNEYGGVWADATLLCRRPLDSWLSSLLVEGFFAFHRPGPDREISSWFLASSEPGNLIIQRWHDLAQTFWKHHSQTGDYFWFHHLFSQLAVSDTLFRQSWSRVPKISAVPCHRAQRLGLDADNPKALERIEEEAAPVLKLTHRCDSGLLKRSCLVSWLLQDLPPAKLPPSNWLQPRSSQPLSPIAGLAVSTENLGDHIQIQAADVLLSRLWRSPSVRIDRDHQIASLASVDMLSGRLPIVMNGWFKTNHDEWPPHPDLKPAYVGFHLRPSQCPALLSKAAIEHYRKYAPIGCRDIWTMKLLDSHGVSCYLSHCLSLAFPRRPCLSVPANEVFVVSRDPRICAYVPADIGPYTYISHYSGCVDFNLNLLHAQNMLRLYASRAKLVVTTLLHCALPAIAMGIPVVMVWPLNRPDRRESDRQRFSSLAGMTTIYDVSDLTTINWNVQPVDCVAEKLSAYDGFARATKAWNLPAVELAWRLAPASVLPPPA